MKLYSIMSCLLMSFACFAMNENQVSENNKINLQKALACARKKNPTEIVIFQYTKLQEQENVRWYDGQKSLEYLQKQLKECYVDTVTNICFKSGLEDNMIAENGKTIVYMSLLKLPINHNDNDLWQLKKRFDTLKENQATTPFIIATDNDTTARDLGNYLERQYPDHVIVYFPTKRGYFFTQPFVIAGGIVAVFVCWYFLLRCSYQ